MAQRNGSQVSVVQVPEGLEGLMEALAGGRRKEPAPQSYEEGVAQARASFEGHLDRALGTCPGDADPKHRQMTESLTALVKAVYKTEIMPEPVVDAVVKLLVYDTLHTDDHGEAFKRLFAGPLVADALLVAGAVLRVKDLPDTTGIARTDGRGQYL